MFTTDFFLLKNFESKDSSSLSFLGVPLGLRHFNSCSGNLNPFSNLILFEEKFSFLSVIWTFITPNDESLFFTLFFSVFNVLLSELRQFKFLSNSELKTIFIRKSKLMLDTIY